MTGRREEKPDDHYDHSVLIRTNSFVLYDVNVNAQLLIWKNFRILNESKVNLVEPDFYRSPLNYLRFLVVNYLKRRTKKIAGISVWVVDIWAQNYYHWLVDALPKLLSTRLAFKEITLVLPSNCNDLLFLKESLKLLGVRFEFFDAASEHVRCSCLYVPLNVSIHGTANPLYIQKMRQLLMTGAALTNSTGNRVYASRRLAKKRKVVNEEEVMVILMRYDFSIVDFETLSFQQQMQTCASAEVLVGLHGAGLTNMIFLPANANVIELSRRNDVNDCYYHLAEALGLNYFSLICESADNDLHFSDFIVDIEKLEVMLASSLGSPKR